MKGKERVFIIECVMLILAAMIFSSAASYRKIEPGEVYRCVSTEEVPRYAVPQLLTTRDNIVLFYDEDGIVNVYDFSGNFLYEHRIEPLKNGKGRMAYDGTYLYVKSRSGTLYIFQGKSLLRYLSPRQDVDAYRENAQKLDETLPREAAAAVYFYNEAGNCVQRFEEGKAIETVIRFPERWTVDAASVAIVVGAVAALAFWIDGRRRMRG